MSGPDPATTEWVPIWNPTSQGPVGPQGPQGDPGPAGADGGTTPHHAKHEPGGTDALVGAAWTDVANIFTRPQEIDNRAVFPSSSPTLRFNDTAQVADARMFQIVNSTQYLYLEAVNDAISVSQGSLRVSRMGDLRLQRNIASAAGQSITLVDGNQASGQRVFQIVNAAAGLTISAMDDTVTTALGSVSINRLGNLTVGGTITSTARPLTISAANAGIVLIDPNLSSTTRRAELTLVGQNLFIQLVDDPVTVGQNVLAFYRDGHVAFSGQVELPSFNPTLKFGGGTNAFPALRNTGAILDVVTADTPASAWASFRAANFTATMTGSNFQDLTVGALAANTLSTTGNVTSGGDFASFGYLYPGLYPSGGQQASFFLAGSTTWGLFTNTSFYATNGLYGSLVNVSGAATASSLNITGTSTLSTITCSGGLTINQANVVDLDLYDTVSGVLIRLLNYQQRFQYYNNTIGGVFQVDGNGHTYIRGNFFDLWRTTGMGEWTDYNPATSCDNGVAVLQLVYASRFTLVGHMMTVQFYLNIGLSGSPTYIYISLPSGYLPSHHALSATYVSQGSTGVGGTGAVLSAAPGNGNFILTLQPPAGFIATSHWIATTITFSIQ